MNLLICVLYVSVQVDRIKYYYEREEVLKVEYLVSILKVKTKKMLRLVF